MDEFLDFKLLSLNVRGIRWRGKLFFAHGSNHSCGVIILVRSDKRLRF